VKDKVCNDFGIPLFRLHYSAPPAFSGFSYRKLRYQVVVTGLLNVILSDWASLLNVQDWQILLKNSLLAGALKRDSLCIAAVGGGGNDGGAVGMAGAVLLPL
jgi:hypothetical protein